MTFNFEVLANAMLIDVLTSMDLGNVRFIQKSPDVIEAVDNLLQIYPLLNND